MASHKKQTLPSVQSRRRRQESHDSEMSAFDQLKDSVLVKLMKACANYDDLYRLYQQPIDKQPDTCMSNRSGVC
jgi:hypothetical protein